MKRLILGLLILCSSLPAHGFDRPVTVKSFTCGETKDILDTLDTSDPRVKLILFSNGTWEFRKDRNVILQDSTFIRHWSTTDVHPFGDVKLEDIPYRAMICLKDSLDSYCCPDTAKVFSKFGLRRGRHHMGCDIPLPAGTPVHACFSGKVRISKYSKGYGNLVIIRHPNGLETFYGHLSSRDVVPDQWVEAGQVIGKIGSTGRSTGPHLHFETRYNGYAFDPEWIINFEEGNLRKDGFVLKRKYFSIYSKYTPESIDEEEAIILSDEEEAAELKRLKAEREAMRYYTIKSGDTLSRIAVKYGTTVSAICKLNGISPNSTLRIGKTIRVR